MLIGPRPEPPVDTVRLAIQGTNFGHKWVNVFWLHLTTTGAKTVNDLNAIVDTILTSYNTQFVAQMASSVAGGTGDATWITSAGNQLATSRPKTWTPSAAVGVQDAAAAYVVDHIISARYRGGHPRTYLPGVATNLVTNGSDLVGSVATALTTAATAFRNAVNAASSGGITAVELGTVSFVTHDEWRTPPVFRAYTGSKIRTKLGSQRRRILA